LPAEDRYVLEFAADAHGVSTAGLALAIVQTVLAEGLLDSLLDDREAVASDDVRPMRRDAGGAAHVPPRLRSRQPASPWRAPTAVCTENQILQ
jgi:hypothetical protein